MIVVDIEQGKEIASAELLAEPGGLLVAPSGVVAVALPASSQVQLLFDGKSLSSTCAVATAAEPVALALTPDAQTLLVASAWGHTLGAYRSSTLSELYRLELQHGPRAVIVGDDGRHAFISHGFGGC